MKSKLASFTISEMLVVLVITAVIISLSLTILNLVQSSFSRLQSKIDKSNETSLMVSRMGRDLHYYNKVSVDEDKNLKFRNPLDSVQYKLVESFIIIQEDTIGKDILDVILYYKGDRVITGLVDAIKLKTAEKENVFFLFKSNSVEEKFREHED